MILPQSLPALKTFCRPLQSLTSVLLLSRLIAGFLEHLGRMSASQERVLAGPKPRPKVRSLLDRLQAKDFEAYQLQPGRGDGRQHRRLSRFRVGRKAKTRTYYVHGEQRDVHSVGVVSLVFSTKEPPQARATVRVQKILMSNATALTAAEVVELYDRRWQIELFFKELKSTFGFHQYQFRKFTCVESWVELALTAFLYLERYRAEQLARRGRSEKELVSFVYLEWRRARALRRRQLPPAQRRFWESQRSYGGCQAVRHYAEAHDLSQLDDWLRTATGRKKLRRALGAARPPEYRVSA